MYIQSIHRYDFLATGILVFYIALIRLSGFEHRAVELNLSNDATGRIATLLIQIVGDHHKQEISDEKV